LYLNEKTTQFCVGWILVKFLNNVLTLKQHHFHMSIMGSFNTITKYIMRQEHGQEFVLAEAISASQV